MSSLASNTVTSVETRRTSGVLSNGMLGMLIFVAMEVMFFSGFISAFTITKAGTPPGLWPPPNQPILPAQQTALNTAFLLFSGVLLWAAGRAVKKNKPSAKGLWAVSWLLGAAFVALQGREWKALLEQGLTLQSSSLGAFFYLIVGAHALHAIGALVGLGWAWFQLNGGKLSKSALEANQVFWYFVVLIWPLIYSRVYL